MRTSSGAALWWLLRLLQASGCMLACAGAQNVAHTTPFRMVPSLVRTGKEEDTIRKDLMRDNFMSAEEAKDYGLIDQAATRSCQTS